MKLLLCKKCGDVFSLKENVLKTCSCGEVSGKYIDQQNAVFTGEHAVMLGFANWSLVNAINKQGIDFTAFTIKEPCTTFKRVTKDEILRL